MRIAQVAPLIESVPPIRYGGTERIVSYLTDELVRQGHEVTLFASGDSRTLATLEPVCFEAQRLRGCADWLAEHVFMLEQVARRARHFDLIHFHLSHIHLPLARRLPAAHVTTLHGRLDLPELQSLYDEFTDAPLASISDAQRTPLRQAGWVGTVYHGLPQDQLRFSPQHRGYLAFLGRISPEKRVDRAIAIARACGIPLKIAAKVDAADREYYDTTIRPLLDHPLVELIGEIGEDQKSTFLGGARALLFPIDWPEPFGIVMIEALACGVPVVAFRGGSVAEVIDDGITGFVVDTMEGAIAATRQIDAIDRRACRATFERRFTVDRMASEYVQIYESLVARATPAADLVA